MLVLPSSKVAFKKRWNKGLCFQLITEDRQHFKAMQKCFLSYSEYLFAGGLPFTITRLLAI